MAPARIAGRYELQERLGEGGMGVVWRALDTKTGSYVAVKVMKDISDPVAVDLFTKEWRALADLSHPNIVEVRDVDVIEENRQRKPLFVMPLLRGATLAELISNASARLTPARIVEIMTQVCRGLQAAHQRGLVHRDLKPSNIFVMDDDTAKIIDFGVVHLAGSKSVTGQKGTFQYMSPEQAQLKQITPASDLFSLGVILYEALTLRKPFARPTADETMEAVIKYIPPPVSEINSNINQSVSKVVHKCLAKLPIHRFASAKDLAETLQRAFRNEAVFDSAKIEPRIERARVAFKSGDDAFASEILAELEAEGNLDPRITVLRMQIDLTVKQKKIRQLLESARARMEQDEIPLALDKLREVLELDPQNSDALGMRQTMEKQRSETQITKWFELAQTHLGNRDFGAARHAVQEVLAIRGGDSRALDLMEKIQSTEADAKRIRDQKEQLYSSALRAYQNGEIETALSKLERLFSVARSNPNAAIPERDAVYQSFYKEVRSERDIIHSALEEAQRQFSDKNFAAAMGVCRDLLTKYPNDGTFHALKIRIEDAERQELSSYIAEVSKRVESEPDLDRRANILREACEHYPNEAQFALQLKLIRERRDLVNAIVAKARQYEERGQHAEAISQWDTLRNIHPQYPGIAFELEQCKKKRDRQAREEEHSHLVEEIDGLMESRAYAKAIECADAALRDFAGDTELSGLRTLAEQGLERTKESRRLFEEGQRALEARDLDRATELLRSGVQLDPRGPGLRDSLVSVLAERARALVDENWQAAEPLYQEASELDSHHSAVRALRSSISEAKRQAFVGQCLTECRSLVAAGNPHAAAERLRAGRAEYPNDARLEQFGASLQKEVNEVRYRDERGKDRAVLGESRRALEQNPDRANLRQVLERSYAIRARHPDDAEIGQSVAEIELTAKRVAGVEDLSQLLTVETAFTGTDGRPSVVSRPAPRPSRVDEKKLPKLVGKSGEKTKLFPAKETERKDSAVKVSLRNTRKFVTETMDKGVALVRPAGKWSQVRLGAICGIVVAVAVTGYFFFRAPHSSTPSVPPTPPQYFQMAFTPADSTVTASDGQPITNGTVAAGATVSVARLGYKPATRVPIRQQSDGKIVLEPEPLHLSIETPESGAIVALDDQPLTVSLDDYSIPADGTAHKLSATAQGKVLFTLEFKAQAGARPVVTNLEAKDRVVITSLGNEATVYGGSSIKSFQFGGQSLSPGTEGTNLNLTATDNPEITLGTGKDQASVAINNSNAPVLAVHSLISNEGQVRITTNVEQATLTVDGIVVPRQKHGWVLSRSPGPHNFAVIADGYGSQLWTMSFLRGQTLKKDIVLQVNAKSTPMSALVITGGTPDAMVDIDEKGGGLKTSETGYLRIPDALPAGKHTITLAKPDYETHSFEVSANPPSETTLQSPALTQLGATVTFSVSPRNAVVKYRRSDDRQMHEVKPFTPVHLAAGEYDIEGTAEGYQPKTDKLNLSKGAVITFPLTLPPLPDGEFGDPSQITHNGEWVLAKNHGAMIYLKPGLLHENLIFTNPGKNKLFRDKKVEWLIESGQGALKIVYDLEGQKLTHRFVGGAENSDPESVKVDTLSKDQNTPVSVHVRVDGGKVRITNDKGDVLNDFTAPVGENFANGRIGIKTDALFIVRSEN